MNTNKKQFDALEYERIEAVMLRAIPALDEMELQGWLLRYANGYTGRSNSVYVQSTEAEPDAILENIQFCEDWYRARDSQPRFRLTNVRPFPAVREILAGKNFKETHTIQIMTRVINRQVNRALTSDQIVFRSIDDWVRDFQTLHGLNEKDAPVLTSMLSIHPGENCLVRIEKEGIPVAVGRGVLDGADIGLFNFFVDENHRKSGYGTAMLNGIQEWALERGARLTYLQVDSVNQPAINLYQKAGFETMYEYWYLFK